MCQNCCNQREQQKSRLEFLTVVNKIKTLPFLVSTPGLLLLTFDHEFKSVGKLLWTLRVVNLRNPGRFNLTYFVQNNTAIMSYLPTLDEVRASCHEECRQSIFLLQIRSLETENVSNF